MFKSISVFICLFSLPLLAEVPEGKYENLYFSPVTGDVGGFSIVIKKSGKTWTGELAVAAGQLDPPVKLQNISCQEKAGYCDFKCSYFGDIQDCSLYKIPGGAVLFLKKLKMSQLLFENENSIPLAEPDRFSHASGEAYEKPDKKSKMLFNLPALTKVKLITYHNETDYMVEIEYKNKIIFVDYNNFGSTGPAAITGDKVRFRKAASLQSEIIAELPRWTIVGLINYTAENGKWAMITLNGQRGYVAKEFITGY